MSCDTGPTQSPMQHYHNVQCLTHMHHNYMYIQPTIKVGHIYIQTSSGQSFLEFLIPHRYPFYALHQLTIGTCSIHHVICHLLISQIWYINHKIHLFHQQVPTLCPCCTSHYPVVNIFDFVICMSQ